METEKTINFKALNTFWLKIRYMDNQNKRNVNYRHIHSVYEIYINISGDVSFMVEDTVYPIAPGNVIITKPYQSHHCILNSNENHRHFWILFDTGNNDIFNDFFDCKENGNLIELPEFEFDTVTGLCRKLLEPKKSEADKFSDFFLLISCLKAGRTKNNVPIKLSNDIMKAIEYINDNFYKDIYISELAKEACMSISTFERHFKTQTGISPREYLQSKRISYACSELDRGSSVQAACINSGFANCSYFIKTFKKTVGVTPSKYKGYSKNLRIPFNSD